MYTYECICNLQTLNFMNHEDLNANALKPRMSPTRFEKPHCPLWVPNLILSYTFAFELTSRVMKDPKRIVQKSPKKSRYENRGPSL